MPINTPEEELYAAKVKLPSKMITNYGHLITLKQEMNGTANIITENVRLLYCLFSPIRNIFEREHHHEIQAEVQ